MPPKSKELPDRVLILELNFKNFMDRFDEKIDAILEKVNEVPKTYARKEELSSLCSRLEIIEEDKINTKQAWAKNRWAISVALISLIGTLFIAFKK